MSDLDAFLAECDDVIDDWEGSADSAEWAGDGSHEYDTFGHYYDADGRPPSAYFILPDLAGPAHRIINQWREGERISVSGAHVAPPPLAPSQGELVRVLIEHAGIDGTFSVAEVPVESADGVWTYRLTPSGATLRNGDSFRIDHGPIVVTED